MADAIVVYVDDIVQLNGTRKRGKVLDWKLIDRPMMAQQMSGAFVPVSPIAGGDILIWPLNGIILIERHMRPSPQRLLDDSDFRF